MDEGYPLSLNEWKLIDPFLSGVDSVVNGKGAYEGKTYFFKGSQYMRYDWASDQIENGAQDIGSWRLEFNGNSIPKSIGLVTLLQKAADSAFSLISLSLSDSRAKIHSEKVLQKVLNGVDLHWLIYANKQVVIQKSLQIILEEHMV
ncbi:MAG: hypothetical protein IPH77_17295 [Ignavibacteria bacterium]|nr:hypothetical protein [Ignavibacteria bacterium]